MTIEPLEGELSVCQVADYTQVALDAPMCFPQHTDTENSLVCLTRDVPANTTRREDGWRAFRVAGTLDFSLIGILARITAVLAAERIGVFVVSTYDTDYVLTRREQFPQALAALAQAGWAVAADGSAL